MHFYKYQGTGNDFIIIDDRKQTFNLTKNQINHLCHRRFGIGADGFMLLQNADGYDFAMVYYNSDGSLGTMCGNGGRCLVRFAADLGIVKNVANFIAVDGPHEAFIEPDKISLKMQDVKNISKQGKDFFTNTGSPHHVSICEHIQELDVFNLGKEIRHSSIYASQNGTNVNFIEQNGSNSIFVRTFERGVEDETFSCGTGVTASALVAHEQLNLQSPVEIETLGGNLSVKFNGNQATGYKDIFLTGPAKKVFEGEVKL